MNEFIVKHLIIHYAFIYFHTYLFSGLCADYGVYEKWQN